MQLMLISRSSLLNLSSWAEILKISSWWEQKKKKNEGQKGMVLTQNEIEMQLTAGPKDWDFTVTGSWF